MSRASQPRRAVAIDVLLTAWIAFGAFFFLRQFWGVGTPLLDYLLRR